jgi:hypothetical protein
MSDRAFVPNVSLRHLVGAVGLVVAAYLVLTEGLSQGFRLFTARRPQ